MKTYGEWMYRATFSWPRHYLDLSGQLHAPTALPPGKAPPLRYPLDRRLGGPQSRSGRCGEEKILDPTGTRILNSSVVQPVAIFNMQLGINIVDDEDDWWMANLKKLKGYGRFLVKVSPRYIPGWTEKNKKNPIYNIRCTRRYSNRASPRHESMPLPLQQPAR
jgi:hypothetical protein